MLGGKEAWENVDSTEGKYLPLFCLKFLIMCSDFLHWVVLQRTVPGSHE